MSKHHTGFNEAKQKGWKKKFQGYFDHKKPKPIIFTENCEFVIEKLAVKCLRSSDIVISADELSEPSEPQISTTSETSSSSIEPPKRNFSRSIKKFSSIPKKFSIKPNKNISLEEFDSLPSVSSSKPLKKSHRKTEIINWFTAFHPHLKESERPPKEPINLKLKKNKRSLAEELSEQASKDDRNRSSNTNLELETETVLASKSSSTSDQSPI